MLAVAGRTPSRYLRLQRQIACGFWLAATVGLAVLYVRRPELIEPANLVDSLRGAGPLVLLAYVAVSVLRPVTLVPSTVLIVAGTLLFPDRYALVFAVSLASIVASAALIYYFFDFLGLADLFERRHAARVRWLEAQVRARGFWIVAGWSVFPFVPTDVIGYVAGSLRMPLGKYLLGVTVGEIPIVAFYVAGGTWLFSG